MDSEYSMGYQLTMELLREQKQFTAIAGQNDMMAIGAIDALEKSRIRVPKDVSVIGCDDDLGKTSEDFLCRHSCLPS